MHKTGESAAHPPQPTYDFPDRFPEERLRELILYIAAQCEEEPTFGAVMLNKILWFLDASAYADTGKPITGTAYIKLPNGPVPERMQAILSRMQTEKEVFVHERERFGYKQKRIVPLREPNLADFTAEEIAHVSKVIRALCRYTAKEVSELSHSRAWKIAAIGERIPYEAVFLSNEPVTEADEEWARRLQQKYGWGTM